LLHNPSTIIIIAILGFLLIVTAIIWAIKMRKLSSEFQMQSILKPYIRDEVKQIIIPDGIGGLLEIEHLILLDQGLFLVETYPMAGNLYGADTIDQWTQIIDGRSYKFANPLRRIRTSRQALISLAPDVPVFCRVIFNSDSIFPKGKPDEVSVLESLENDMLMVKNEKIITQQAQQAWNTIMRIARKDGQAVIRQGNLDG
jgi:hypothetical protein